jgi:hypothetical protein
MRCLLLIPVLLLFLSNIPFIHKMEMKEVASVKKDGCCRKSGNPKGICKMSEEKAGANEQKTCHKEERTCSKQTESTCICICCFQFAAPDQFAVRPQFNCDELKQSLAIFLLQNWKDPQLAVPWQPPDV